MAGPLDYVAGNPGFTMDPYLMMGLGMLGNATQPGPVGIGRGALQGLQAYQQAQGMELQNEAARRALGQAGRWSDYVTGLPPDQQELMGALGPEAGSAYLTEQMKRRGGAWQGTGMQAQAANTYNQLMSKVQAGVPLTPEEETNLSIAYQTMTQPKTLATPEGTYSYPGMQLPSPPGMAGAPGIAGPGMAGALAVPGPGMTGVPSFTPTKSTEGERKAASLYGRASDANEALAELEGLEGFDPAAFSGRAVKDFLGGRMAESSGPLTSILGSLITSDEYNLYTSAAGDFIASILRYDSGAAVPDTEFYRYYNTYFPVPGQGPEVRRAKARRREIATEALQVSAARGLSEADSRRKANEIRKQVAKEVPLPKEPEAPTSGISTPSELKPAPVGVIPGEDEDEILVNF